MIFSVRTGLSILFLIQSRITRTKWLNLFSWLAKCRLPFFLLAKKGKKRHSWLRTRLFGKNPGWEKPLR